MVEASACHKVDWGVRFVVVDDWQREDEVEEQWTVKEKHQLLLTA